MRKHLQATLHYFTAEKTLPDVSQLHWTGKHCRPCWMRDASCGLWNAWLQPGNMMYNGPPTADYLLASEHQGFWTLPILVQVGSVSCRFSCGLDA